MFIRIKTKSSFFQPNYTEVAKYCNIWRNYDDIQDSWTSVLSIVDYYAKNVGGFAEVAGPGGFNDPDEVHTLCYRD